MRRLLLACLFASLPLSQGCVLEWIDYFSDLTTLGSSSDEHRVRDLRVLAIAVEPPELRVPLEAFAGGDVDLTLRVEPFAYDPRGGEVDAALQVCVRSLNDAAGPFGPLEAVSPSICLDERQLADAAPEVAASLLPPARTASAGSAASGGRLEGLEHTLRFDAAALRALAALAGKPDVGLRGFEVILALTVSRVWLGEPEVEQALLPLSVRPELGEGADPTLLAALLEREGAELCDPEEPRDCVDPAFAPQDGEERPDRTGGPPSECGDGFLEPPEQCDPPQPGFCSDACRLDNVCERTCAFAVPPNTRPRVFGLERVDGVFEGQAMRLTTLDEATLRDGDTVRLLPGETLQVGAVVEETSASERAAASWGPEVYEELLQSRWYVFGDGGDLVAPAGVDGQFVGQGYNGAVRYQSLPAGHTAGARAPFVLVVSDERGGMSVTTLELSFE